MADIASPCSGPLASKAKLVAGPAPRKKTVRFAPEVVEIKPEHCFAFVFPGNIDRLGPSLPLAHLLAERGHDIHYLCHESMRKCIEDTGAVFHPVADQEQEPHEVCEADLWGTTASLVKEHGLEHDPAPVAACKLRNVKLERRLPGLLSFLRGVGADSVLYCPITCREAAFAAKALDIPRVALLTVAGPERLAGHFRQAVAREGLALRDVDEAARAYGPNVAAVRRLSEEHALELEAGLPEPPELDDALAAAARVLVTTSEDLQDPMTPQLARAYEQAGTTFAAVGPLLDLSGEKASPRSRRSRSYSGDSVASTVSTACSISSPSVHLSRCQLMALRRQQEELELAVAQAADEVPAKEAAGCGAEVLSRVQDAHAKGRPVVLVSLGATVPGDHGPCGLEGDSPAGCGLSGRMRCRAAWAGAFDALGAASEDDGALVLTELGPLDCNALGEVVAPPNAVCVPFIPQADVLGAGVDLLLTHGGQTGLTEALVNETPVLVCPPSSGGEWDANGRQAAALGVGLKVDAPEVEADGEAEAAELYRAKVSRGLRELMSSQAFRDATSTCAKQLRAAGGTLRAAEILLSATAAGTPPKAALFAGA